MFQGLDIDNKTSEIDWVAVSQGTRLNNVPPIFTDVITDSCMAARKPFKNGHAKAMIQSLINIFRANALCQQHRELITVNSPSSVTDGWNIKVKLRRGTQPSELRGYPDVVVRLTTIENVVVMTTELKNSASSGISTNQMKKSCIGLGQLLAYMIGHTMVNIAHVDSLNKLLRYPMLGIYMEGSLVVLVRGLVDQRGSSSYRLRMQLTPFGTKAIDLFSPHGCAAVMKQVHNAISVFQVGEEVESSEEVWNY